MAKERKASVIYEGNGTQQTFSFPFDYLRKAFIKAEIVEGSGITELEQGKDYSITNKELTLASGVSVATGNLLKIYRETTTDPLVEWQDASVLRSADLSLQEVQLLHLSEETADKVFDSGMSTDPTNSSVWDGQYKRITNLLDPQEEGDAMTLRYANANKDGIISAIKSTGASQVASITSTGDAQNTSLTTTGNTQNTRLTTTGDTQNKRLTDTGDTYVATMTTLKDTATTQASNASNSASSASASASIATTKATNASNSASNASSSASTATTKATEASNSANLSKSWAMSDSSPDGVSGNKSSKTWANEAKNSASSAKTSETNAKTSETNAANSATEAANSAENAKTFDPSSYFSKTEITQLFSTLMHTQYPVGSYIYSDKADNPATYLPYMSDTTWVQTAKGRVLIGAGTADSGTVYTAGQNGGEEKHQLTTSEMPSHAHGRGTMNITGTVCSAYGETKTTTSGAFTWQDTGGRQDGGNGHDGEPIQTSTISFDASRNWTGQTSTVGGNASHNNMQPFSVVYIFKRTI